MNTDQGSRIAGTMKQMNHGDTEAQRSDKAELGGFGFFSVPRCLCGFPSEFLPQMTQVNADQGIDPAGLLSAISA